MSQSNPSFPAHTAPQQGIISNASFHLSDLDLQQTFRLIDALLPLQSCVYHQILPLNVADNSLKLGMVNPQDQKALEYVQPILTSLNCTLQIQPIDWKSHQLIVSAYLNYTRTEKQAEEVKSQKREKTPPDQTPSSKSRAQVAKSSNERTTLIVDSPEELISESHEPSETTRSKPSSVVPESASPKVPAQTRGRHEALPIRPPVKSPAKPETSALKPPLEEVEQINSFNQYASLKVEAQYLSAPAEFLATLTPQQLWRELLARVLVTGIGRLYFERLPDHGRILLSQNGVLQTSLPDLSPSVFQGVLNQLKQLAHLPPIPLEKPKKVEMEQYYQQERILLRLHLIPGKYGEEGTLQVLRGKALMFYQQRQMDELGEQALKLAQQLERKLRQIYVRTRINPAQLHIMPELYEIEERIKQQLDLLSRKHKS